MQSTYVSAAMSRLRGSVSLCCWVIGASLMVQLLIWCMAMFTQVRYETATAPVKPGLVIASRDVKGVSVTVKRPNGSTATDAAAPPEPAAPQRELSKFDPMLAKASSLAMASGTFATCILLPLIALGVLLGAGSATTGVEQTVSAFIWSIILALLVLPFGETVGLPWKEGALTTYHTMTQQVDFTQVQSADAWGGPTFYARFAFMPLACIAGIAMVGLRFSSGVNAGIIPKENFRLDPALEKEAANIKPTSLHGGRAAAAMRVANAANSTAERKPVMAAAGVAATSTTSAGEAPRRLI
jgi:hypothetical protein